MNARRQPLPNRDVDVDLLVGHALLRLQAGEDLAAILLTDLGRGLVVHAGLLIGRLRRRTAVLGGVLICRASRLAVGARIAGLRLSRGIGARLIVRLGLVGTLLGLISILAAILRLIGRLGLSLHVVVFGGLIALFILQAIVLGGLVFPGFVGSSLGAVA